MGAWRGDRFSRGPIKRRTSARGWRPRDEMGLNKGDRAQEGNKDTRVVRAWGLSEAVSMTSGLAGTPISQLSHLHSLEPDG